MAAEPLSYRAFLSYSHKDQDVADELHGELEGYQIPRELQGQSGARGLIGEKLRPIFRDRYDLEAGHSLAEQVSAALQASEALIVVCSPDSARSRYVNEEIRQFKALGRADRIYAIIVGGEPGDPERECFPAVLRSKVLPDGTVTDMVEEPIAADMRLQGDGPDLARMKLIAGLLGVDLDILRRREAEEHKRQKRFWIGLTTAMTVLAFAAIVGGLLSYKLKQDVAVEKTRNDTMLDATLKRTSGLLQAVITTGHEHGVPLQDNLAVLERARGLFDDIETIGATTPLLPLREAELQRIFATSYAQLGRTGEQFKVATTALGAITRLSERRPNDPLVLNELANAWKTMGRAYSTRRELTQAIDCYGKALAIRMDKLGGEQAPGADELTALAELLEASAGARLLRGDKGDSDAAQRAAEASLRVADRLTELHGRTAVAIERRGRALIMLSDIFRGRKEYAKALDTARLGIDQDAPDEIDGLVSQQRNKASLLEVRGDVYFGQRKWQEAREAYAQSMAIRQRLSDRDTHNAVQIAEVSYSKIKLGEVLLKLDDVDGAGAAFRVAAANYERMIASNKDNQAAARQLIDALDGLRDLSRRKRDFVGWTQAVERSIEVARNLRRSDDNRFSRRLVADKLTSYAELELDRNQPAAARPYLDEAAALLRQDAAAGIASINEERELSSRFLECGDKFMEAGQMAEAGACYADSLRIRRVHGHNPEASVAARTRLAEILERQARHQTRDRQPRAALMSLREVVHWRRGIVASDASEANKRALARAIEQTVGLELSLPSSEPELPALEQALAIRSEQHAAAPGDRQRRGELAETLRLVGLARREFGDCTGATAALDEARTQVAALETGADGAEQSEQARDRRQAIEAELAATSQKCGSTSKASGLAPEAPSRGEPSAEAARQAEPAPAPVPAVSAGGR